MVYLLCLRCYLADWRSVMIRLRSSVARLPPSEGARRIATGSRDTILAGTCEHHGARIYVPAKAVQGGDRSNVRPVMTGQISKPLTGQISGPQRPGYLTGHVWPIKTKFDRSNSIGCRLFDQLPVKYSVP